MTRLAIVAGLVVAACTGPAGPPGSAGGDGATGAPGSAGAPGPQGSAGEPGSDGAMGSQGSNGPVGGQPANSVIAGHWQYVSGPLIQALSFDTIEALDLSADATGTLFERSPFGINGCARLTFAVLNDQVAELDVPDLPFFNGPQIVGYALPDPDTLQLTDSDANVTTFTREDAIPDDVTCPAATIGAAVALPDPPDGALVSNGAQLWYQTGTQVIELDPASGSAVGEFAVPGNGVLLAVDQNVLWVTRSSNLEELAPFTMAGSGLAGGFTRIAAPFAELDEIQAATFDDNHQVWIAASAPPSSQTTLLHMSTIHDEIATVDNSVDTGRNVTALAFANGKLWFVTSYVGSVLVEVDPAVGITATFALPDTGVGGYAGLTVNGGALYAIAIVASDDSESAELLPIVLP
jgi:hypothetical protein|nr:hypothetical protein [Kofleriaceae bacterium]